MSGVYLVLAEALVFRSRPLSSTSQELSRFWRAQVVGLGERTAIDAIIHNLKPTTLSNIIKLLNVEDPPAGDSDATWRSV